MMNKLMHTRRSLMALFLAGVILVSGTAYVAAEEEALPDDTDVAAEEEADEEADDGDVLLTEEQALAAMTLYAEKGDYQLYASDTEGAFALRVKSTGYIWWSSPINADSDPLAKGAQIRTMKSAVYFNTGDPVAKRTTKVTAYEGSVQKDTLVTSKIADGVRFDFYIEKQGVTLPLEITLEDDGSLQAHIPVGEIKEDLATASSNGAVIIDLSLLANFGAAGTDAEGYIIVPDGSGAVINYNNGKSGVNLYKGQVYGRDASIQLKRDTVKNEQVYLPVYGLVNKSSSGDNAMLAVAVEGDANAIVRASVAGQSTTSYNTAWFDFQLRTTDSFYIGTANNELQAYENGGIKTGDITVKYYPITGKDLGYADVAAKYRDYLTTEMGVVKKTEADTSDFSVTLYGGVMKKRSVLGMPVELQTIATTYSQAEEILGSLTAAGVGGMNVTYNEVTNSGIKGEITTGLDYSSKLGGEKGFDSLLSYVNSTGSTLYPSANILEYWQSGNGYSYMLNSAKRVTKEVSTQQAYELAFGIPYNAAWISNWTVLSAYYLPDVFAKLVTSLSGEAISSISLASSGEMLYSDFSRENSDGRIYLNRTDMKNAIAAGYKALDDAGNSILAQGANAYVLPYVDYITDVPLYSSNYDLFDYDIPFYQMVIHGLIPYSGKAQNAASNAEEQLLMSLVTGSGVQYELMYESPALYSESRYDHMYYANYEGWVETIGNEYRLFADITASVSDQTITAFEVNGLYGRTATYSDGTVIEVNLSTNEIKKNGVAYDKRDYGLKGEADYAA